MLSARNMLVHFLSLEKNDLDDFEYEFWIFLNFLLLSSALKNNKLMSSAEKTSCDHWRMLNPVTWRVHLWHASFNIGPWTWQKICCGASKMAVKILSFPEFHDTPIIRRHVAHQSKSAYLQRDKVTRPFNIQRTLFKTLNLQFIFLDPH